MATFISDFFGIAEEIFEQYGALNISVVNDLPLFIDPFLLFHSEKPEYVELTRRSSNISFSFVIERLRAMLTMGS